MCARYSVWVSQLYTLTCRTAKAHREARANRGGTGVFDRPLAKFNIWQGRFIFCSCRTNQGGCNPTTIYDELKARGLIAQVTDEEEIKEVINNGKATFYIGFDCTADSLTAGHFAWLTLMKRLQMAGNKPIARLWRHYHDQRPLAVPTCAKMLTKEDTGP